jgi:type I restriction enzyme S subunit
MVLSSQSSNVEPLGVTAMYIFDTPALLNQRVLKLKVLIANNKYLLNTINSLWFHYKVSHKAAGSAQANLKLEHVLEMLVPLPPLNEQKRIVEKIEELFGFIDKLNKEKIEALELVELTRNKIMQDAVQGKLVQQDPNDEPASVLLEKIKAKKEQLIKEKRIKQEKPLPPIMDENIPYELPQGWEWVRVSSITDVGTGSTPLKSRDDFYSRGNIPWVTSSLTEREFITSSDAFITELAVTECKMRIYPENTLIIAMYGQGKTRGQVSELRIQATTNQACACIVPIYPNDILKNYMKIFFGKIYYEIREIAVGGAQPNLNLEKIKVTMLPLPPLNEQKRIVEKFDQLMALCDELEKNVKQSTQKSEMLVQDVLQEAYQ